mmetsp:Transcript_4284/g.16146  ORF Transcript_4284/g.16146 Transcript_4284/m.16146 type:complete len:97 (+) Transcript_4284:1425-1715(+)
MHIKRDEDVLSWIVPVTETCIDDDQVVNGVAQLLYTHVAIFFDVVLSAQNHEQHMEEIIVKDGKFGVRHETFGVPLLFLANYTAFMENLWQIVLSL